MKTTTLNNGFKSKITEFAQTMNGLVFFLNTSKIGHNLNAIMLMIRDGLISNPSFVKKVIDRFGTQLDNVATKTIKTVKEVIEYTCDNALDDLAKSMGIDIDFSNELSL